MQLSSLKLYAGNPSFEELRRRSGVPSSTLSDAVRTNRNRLPRLEVVRAFVAACGGAAADLARWEWAWRALQAKPAVAADPVAGRSQMPVNGVRLVGRHDALYHLDMLKWDQATGRRQATIVTLVGMAGVGKTAAALHWAHRVAATFDGQLYFDLRGHAAGAAATVTEVLRTFLHALGVPAPDVPAEVSSQLSLYRSLSHPRRLLVVLDGARDAGQVRPLLPGGPGCLTLITSRDRLSSLIVREGAQRLSLRPLRPVEADVLVTEMLAHHPGGSDPAAARELARLCGYLPLALRIAVVNLIDHPHWSLADYVARLHAGNLLAELVVPGDDTTSVRAALDLSYTALDCAARRMLSVLAAAPGPTFSTAEAAALAELARTDTTRLLDTLRTVHLVETVGGDRYTLHRLVRAYLRERARAEQPPPARDRLGAADLAAV